MVFWKNNKGTGTYTAPRHGILHTVGGNGVGETVSIQVHVVALDISSAARFRRANRSNQHFHTHGKVIAVIAMAFPYSLHRITCDAYRDRVVINGYVLQIHVNVVV